MGGAIFLEDAGVVFEISHSGEFFANGAQDVGGAVAVLFGASFIASDTSFAGNFAAEGGAIWGQVKLGICMNRCTLCERDTSQCAAPSKWLDTILKRGKVEIWRFSIQQLRRPLERFCY